MIRTKVVDEQFAYQGINQIMAHCRVRIYTADGMVPVVIASECADNPGSSVTHSAEILFPSLIAKYLPGWLDQADNLVLVEHYPDLDSGAGTFDQVLFSHWRPTIVYRWGSKHVTFGKAHWQHVRHDRVIGLVGEEILNERQVR